MTKGPIGSALRAYFAAVAICTAVALALSAAAQSINPRDALWIIVHDQCLTDQLKNHDPRPCVRVDLDGGAEKGFAVLKDIRGATQFLVLPTARISGIESAALLGPDTPNYFADAWEARTYVDEALHGKLNVPLSREDIGLAVNSLVSRSQDQLHIHVDCVRSDVAEALKEHGGSIGDAWAPLEVPLAGRHYEAMWMAGEHLGSYDPFRLLADKVPGAAQKMGDWTLVVVGAARANGTPGFILLADRVNPSDHDTAHGEDLLDHACAVATSRR
jgi:CDP-diacylglycerol pyrophosphatase